MMEKMTRLQKFNPLQFVKKAFVIINKGFLQGRSLTDIDTVLRKLVNSYQLRGAERNRLLRSFLQIARCCPRKNPSSYLSSTKGVEFAMKEARWAEARANMRAKRTYLRNALKSGEQIFFACSKHYPVAKDHKAYQGKIYVDRFWRLKVSGSEYQAVLNFIKENNVKTVQEIIGPDVYLTTRPYCRHYFSGVDTAAVLSGEYRIKTHKARTKREVYLDIISVLKD